MPLYARHRARVGGDAPRRRWAHWPLQRLRRLRAFLLHALWPHDRSVWQRARAPTWWALQAVGVLPWGVGAGWWLLLSLAADLRDEYQLCLFILGFKALSSITGGVFLFVSGAMRAAVTEDLILRCVATHGYDDARECAEGVSTLI